MSNNLLRGITLIVISNLFSKPDLAKVLLFTNKKETTSLYKALAIDFHYQLELGQVQDSEKDLGKSDHATNQLFSSIQIQRRKIPHSFGHQK